ncbi:DUF2339 domain-containing protein [Frigoribacterium sp. ACAM 257]|uniref:DUF2339 domain-containing protein n=1 Tax=Frigoribacterium sp. ACAM 257 TaxID=2508998 RepID=UPI0011B9BC82|nr:DUF2339 domain-containing protein [Frigoribacterium sp. ACAM 257]TWX40279.1 DUF2339 domain-containing protein [Frigoribacterium sp. ACAM 257]
MTTDAPPPSESRRPSSPASGSLGAVRPWLASARERVSGGPVRAAVAVGVALVAALAHLWLQAGMLLTRPDFAWSSFRDYFPYDQLSYMSMVVNTAEGKSDALEPFTETGVNNYPHLWYVALGHISRLTGLDPLQAWAVSGLAVQLVFVAVLALTLVLLTRRLWAGLLAPLPFVVGTFSSFSGSPDGWFQKLDAHAVLWGAFGTLFTINGETVSLCLGGTALLLLLVAWTHVRATGARVALSVVAAGMIGLMANIQTYSFLVTIYLVAFVLAAYWLVVIGRRLLWLVSGAGVVAVFVFGPGIADSAGPLVTLMFGLLPALPGLVVALVRSRGLLAVYGVVALAAAAPQLSATLGGVASGDPFLTYRVASSANLGVDWHGVVGSAALWLPLLGIAAAGVARRRPFWVAYPVGVLAAWFLASSNDIWGANQEPYRFWLDTFVLVCMTILPVGAIVLRDLLVDGPALGPVVRRTVGAVVTVCVGLAALSAVDFVRFAQDDEYHQLIDYNTTRDQAMTAATRSIEDTAGGSGDATGLLVGDPCIEPMQLKIAAGVPVVNYNLGMAWPEDRASIDQVSADRTAGVLDLEHLREANVRWVLTDSACTVNWESAYGAQLERVDSADFELPGITGTITLWRVPA